MSSWESDRDSRRWRWVGRSARYRRGSYNSSPWVLVFLFQLLYSAMGFVEKMSSFSPYSAREITRVGIILFLSKELAFWSTFIDWLLQRANCNNWLRTKLFSAGEIGKSTPLQGMRQTKYNRALQSTCSQIIQNIQILERVKITVYCWKELIELFTPFIFFMAIS